MAVQLFGERSSEPDTFRFGAEPGQSIERRIRLKRASPAPFTILSAAVTDGNVPNASVSFEAVAPNTWELVLTATAGPRPSRCLGKVSVQTDVPGEENIRIPIVGTVRERPGGA